MGGKHDTPQRRFQSRLEHLPALIRKFCESVAQTRVERMLVSEPIGAGKDEVAEHRLRCFVQIAY
ncbi:MAG: hypothetical protein AAF687_14320, partial [Pseudomonadota bacterium]